MKININAYQLADLLMRDKYAGWTPEAALAIAHYYEAMEEEADGITVDIVAVRCGWNHFDNAAEVASAYKIFASEGADAAELEDKVDEVLGDETTFIKLLSGAYLVMEF